MKIRILSKGIILVLGLTLFFSSIVLAGPNENAGITFDLNATTYGNQNLLYLPEPGVGDYIRLDVYAQDVVNLDTYEFEVIYDTTRLQYITAVPTNPITYEQNILTTNGGTALGWMVDTSTPGVLSIAYTLAGSDTTQAPEGEGLIADIVFQALTTESCLSFGNVYYFDSYGTLDVITSTVMAFLGGNAPPMPPSDFSAYSDTVLHNSIRLTWIDPTENADGTPLDDLTGINVYYADSTFITSVAPGVETYAVQGLTCGEYYNFYVTAYDSETPVGESAPSNIAGAMVIAPMPPSDFSAYSDYTTPNSIQLNWTDPIENIDGSTLTDLNHIDIYYSNGTFIETVNPGVETYTDDGLFDGQLYGYYLMAVANNGNMYNPSDTVTWHAGGSPVPSPPHSLEAYSDTTMQNSIRLTWNDPTTQADGTPLDDLTGINIYFADSTFIASVNPGEETYTVSGLTQWAYYSFYVTAYDDETPINESDRSNIASYTSGGGIINNGDFETGDFTGWNVSGPFYADVIQHQDSWCAHIYIGAGHASGSYTPNDQWEVISQEITLPYGHSLLSFWMETSCPTGWYHWGGYVFVEQDGVYTMLFNHGFGCLHPWQEHIVDLTPWGGQTVNLVFGGHNQNGHSLRVYDIYLDSIRVITYFNWPMPPADLTAYSDYTTPQSIQLTWTDPTENVDGSPLTDLNHIEVYYSDGTFISSVNPGIETYTDDGLTDGQMYSYYLIAVRDDSAASNPSETISWFAGGSPVPSPPDSLVAYSDSTMHASISLTWNDPTTQNDGTPLDDLAGINVYFADSTLIASVDPGVETYTVIWLTPGLHYFFYITAFDNETPVNESTSSDTAGAQAYGNVYPMPPSDLTAYSDYTTPQSIQLFWTDPTENIDGSPLTDLNHIDVYYSDSTFIASVNHGIETYTDVGLLDGQLYAYYLIAVTDDSTITSNHSVTISWHAGGSPIPSPPENLFAHCTSNGTIQITWNDPTTQVDGTPLDDLAGINIFYSDSTFITSVNPGVETYTISGLTPDQYYSFYATAYDNETPVNESESSNTSGCDARYLWYVHPDSTLNSIQAAINLCSYGDIVLVASGTYVENINFNGKSITVGSLFLTTGDTTYISQTIIDGNHNNWHVVEFRSGEDSTAILTGFTIANGGGPELYAGGGIYCDNNSSPSLSYLTITGNYAHLGGGIYCRYSSSPRIENLTISGNSTGRYGGGIHCQISSSPSIKNVMITGNNAGSFGGGISCLQGASPRIENVTISGNTAGRYGGGMQCRQGSNPIITNVIISGNSSGSHGDAIYIREYSSPRIENVTITGNEIYCFDHSHPSIANVIFNNCGITCADHSSPSLTNVTIMGAGISCLYDSSPSLINCIVIRGGNGMYVESGNPSISYSNFWNNNANFNGCDPLIGVNVTTNANGDSCDVYYNIQLDPLFFDPDNEDFHLTAYSPCIDAGTPDTTGLHLPEFDLDGNPRIYNGIYDPVEVPKIIDMGVYEEWRQYGSLEGYVTELDGGAPIEGAEITFVQYTGFTNGDGYYIIDSLLISELVGSYTFTCHKNGYADTLSEGVEILFNYTTTCNFEMTTSTMVIDPLSINEIIAPGEVLTTYITISNNGNAPLNYSISVVQDTKQKYGEGVNRSRYTGKTPVTEKNFKPENRITKGSAKIEFSASPEYLSRKSCNNSAVIGSNVSGWYSAANKSGYTNGRLDEWYTYGDMNAPWQLTWATPERVTYFNPADFGLCYSFDITRISHWFYEHPDYPWDDATFHFKIYADDGVTLLYESEDIEAQHMVEIIHELTTPVTITSGGFYFGVAPVSSSGFPSTCGDNLYTGTNHSYYGSPGNWALWSGPPDMGEFIQGVYLTYHPWMTVEPMSGTVEPGCVDMVAVTFYATGVEAGTIKTADIVITSFDPDVGYVTIPVQLEVTGSGVDDIPGTLSTKLSPNFPNPFYHSTTISFSLKEKGNVKLSVYNIKGQLVETLVDEEMNSGTDYKIIWDGKSGDNELANGIYLYRFETKDKTFIKKMLLLR